MKKIDRRSFAVRAGLGLVGAFSAPVTTSGSAHSLSVAMKLRPLSKGFMAMLPKMTSLANVPGVGMAYVESGRTMWHSEFGVKNKDTKEPVTADTVWQVGSLSKTVFAFGVMKLVDDGKLELDRPLVGYVPGELIKDDPRAKLITARHALSHSTGLQNWRFQAGQNLQLAFTPGERWSYSGEGIFYLQRAVEQITGQGLEVFMQEHVLGPLGMSDSSYAWRPDYDKRVATAHNANGDVAVDYIVQNAPRMQKLADEWKKPFASWRAEDLEKAQAAVETRFPPLPTFFSINAAGTLFTTTADYAKFVSALFDKGLDIMFKPQSHINNSISWGLGWGLQTDGDSTQFWHWGEGINYRTFIIGDRSTRSAVIVFTNARNGRKIWERIVTEATGADQPLFLWLQ